jgi:alpha-D-xyloside xylohydrolase
VSDIAILGGKLRVEVIDDAIVHVVFTRADSFAIRPSVMILPQQVREASLVEQGNDLVLRTEKLQLHIDRHTGNFTWLDKAGEALLRDAGKHLEPVAVERRVFDPSVKITTESTADGLKARVASSKVVIDRIAYQTKLDLMFSEGEAIYGLGQHEEGILNYRGHAQFLYHQNLKVAMPAIVSTRGYGILWDTSSLAVFHDDVYGSYFWTDVDDEMDFYFVAGPDFDDIVKDSASSPASRRCSRAGPSVTSSRRSATARRTSCSRSSANTANERSRSTASSRTGARGPASGGAIRTPTRTGSPTPPSSSKNCTR